MKKKLKKGKILKINKIGEDIITYNIQLEDGEKYETIEYSNHSFMFKVEDVIEGFYNSRRKKFIIEDIRLLPMEYSTTFTNLLPLIIFIAIIVVLVILQNTVCKGVNMVLIGIIVMIVGYIIFFIIAMGNYSKSTEQKVQKSTVLKREASYLSIKDKKNYTVKLLLKLENGKKIKKSTLDVNYINELKIGDEIDVKVYRNECRIVKIND